MIPIEDVIELARRALPGFGLPADADVTFVNYRENHVLRVRSARGDHALKLHRAGYRDDVELASEAAVLEALVGSGIRVPEPVAALAGGHVHLVADRDEMRQTTMQRWFDGAWAIGDSPRILQGGARPTDARYRELGAVMGRLHAFWTDRPLPAGYRRDEWNAAGLAGPTALWGRGSALPSLTPSDRGVLEDAEARLAEELTAAPVAAALYGPVHGDLTVENVLADKDGLVVIDFDDSGCGWYLFDLATAFFFASSRTDADEVLDALTDGYARERALQPEEEGLWHPLLLARALSYLGWSVDRPGDPTTVFHETFLVRPIVAAARRYLDTGRTGWPEPHLGRSAP